MTELSDTPASNNTHAIAEPWRVTEKVKHRRTIDYVIREGERHVMTARAREGHDIERVLRVPVLEAEVNRQREINLRAVNDAADLMQEIAAERDQLHELASRSLYELTEWIEAWPTCDHDDGSVALIADLRAALDPTTNGTRKLATNPTTEETPGA